MKLKYGFYAFLCLALMQGLSACSSQEAAPDSALGAAGAPDLPSSPEAASTPELASNQASTPIQAATPAEQLNDRFEAHAQLIDFPNAPQLQKSIAQSWEKHFGANVYAISPMDRMQLNEFLQFAREVDPYLQGKISSFHKFNANAHSQLDLFSPSVADADFKAACLGSPMIFQVAATNLANANIEAENVQRRLLDVFDIYGMELRATDPNDNDTAGFIANLGIAASIGQRASDLACNLGGTELANLKSIQSSLNQIARLGLYTSGNAQHSATWTSVMNYGNANKAQDLYVELGWKGGYGALDPNRLIFWNEAMTLVPYKPKIYNYENKWVHPMEPVILDAGSYQP